MSKTKVVPISLPKDMAIALDREAKRESMTRSEFVRDMLRKRLAFAELGKFQEEFSRRAKKVGLRTLDDAVRTVRGFRKK